jgi:hypothetical protein
MRHHYQLLKNIDFIRDMPQQQGEDALRLGQLDQILRLKVKYM